MNTRASPSSDREAQHSSVFAGALSKLRSVFAKKTEDGVADPLPYFQRQKDATRTERPPPPERPVSTASPRDRDHMRRYASEYHRLEGESQRKKSASWKIVALVVLIFSACATAIFLVLHFKLFERVERAFRKKKEDVEPEQQKSEAPDLMVEDERVPQLSPQILRHVRPEA